MLTIGTPRKLELLGDLFKAFVTPYESEREEIRLREKVDWAIGNTEGFAFCHRLWSWKCPLGEPCFAPARSNGAGTLNYS